MNNPTMNRLSAQSTLSLMNNNSHTEWYCTGCGQVVRDDEHTDYVWNVCQISGVPSRAHAGLCQDITVHSGTGQNDDFVVCERNITAALYPDTSTELYELDYIAEETNTPTEEALPMNTPMNYLELVAAGTMITVRSGMDDIPGLQSIDTVTLEEAIIMAQEDNRGYCDDRWSIYGINNVELDQLVADNEITGFLINHRQPPTPARFALPTIEEADAWYQDGVNPVASLLSDDDIPF